MILSAVRQVRNCVDSCSIVAAVFLVMISSLSHQECHDSELAHEQDEDMSNPASLTDSCLVDKDDYCLGKCSETCVMTCIQRPPS